MRIYQSSLSYNTLKLIAEYAPDIKVNILRSFDLNNDETLEIIASFSEIINSIILDSGVWFKFTNPLKYNNSVHSVKTYSEFLKQHSDKFDFYINYDEDFTEEQRDEFSSLNEENQKYLESKGHNPVPVLHLLDDDLINYYIEQKIKYPVVAIGSNAIGDPKFNSAVKKLYENQIRVHAFRIGSSSKLTGLHAWSCDCSSHAQWTASGRAVFFDRIKNQETALTFRPFEERTGNLSKDFYQRHPLVDDFIWFIEDVVGVEIDDLIMDSNYRTFSNSIYYWWLERYVTLRNSEAPYNIHFDDIKFDPTNVVLARLFKNSDNGESLDEWIAAQD